MKFKINYSNDNLENDYIIVEGKTIEAVRETALAEIEKRGWKVENCWNEQID